MNFRIKNYNKVNIVTKAGAGNFSWKDQRVDH